MPASDAPARGPHIEVEHPSTGHVFTPTVVGNLQVTPAAGQLPDVTVPVPKDSKWRDLVDLDAPMRCWVDGEQRAVDQLEDVAVVDGKMELRGRGGLELLTRVQAEYDFQEIHTAAKNLVDANTSYQLDFPTPNTTITSGVRVLEATTTTELKRLLLDRERTDAYHVPSGAEPHQSCFTTEGEAFTEGNQTTGTSGTEENDGSYSDGTSASLYRGPNASGGPDYAEWEFTIGYTIPAAEFGAQVRDDADSNGSPAFQWYLIHDNGTRYNMDSLSNVGATFNLGWSEVALEGSTTYDLNFYEGPDLTRGTYRLGVEITDSNGNVDSYGYLVDVVAPYDTRFSYFFDDNNGGSSGYLDGPQLYPDAVDAPMDDAEVSQAVQKATLDVTIDDTSNGQALALSNDLGDTFSSGSNTSTFTHDFTNRGPTVRGKLTLSRYGSRTTATPQTGFKPQTVSEVRIDADLEDMPMVVNRSFDSQLRSVLQTFADEIAEFGWTLDYTTSPPTFSFVQDGDRTATVDESLLDVQDRTTTRERVEKAVIRGGAQDLSGNRIEVSHGTAVDLAKSNLLESTETVRDPETDTRYSRGQDYAIDYDAGTITAKSSGRLENGKIYAVDYRYKPVASYTASGVTNPVERVTDAPAATTSRGCAQIARTVVESLSTPQRIISVTIPPSAAGASTVEALAVAGLEDAGQTHTVQSIETSADGIELELGSRDDFFSEVQELNESLDSLSTRV
ncbi:MAG: hypothetical protein ABEH81_03995 [Halopenitus sp.]